MSAVLGREVKKQNTGIRNQYYHAGGAAPMARDFVQSLYASTFERGDPQFAVDAYARPIRPTLFLIPHEVGAAIRNSDTDCRIWLTLRVLYLFYFSKAGTIILANAEPPWPRSTRFASRGSLESRPRLCGWLWYGSSIARMTRLRRKPAKVTPLALLTADFDCELVARPQIQRRPIGSNREGVLLDVDRPPRARSTIYVHRAGVVDSDPQSADHPWHRDRYFPNVNIPVVAVVWTYTGLNPEEMEGRLTSTYDAFVDNTRR